jgi:hypothetical protein
MTDAVTTKAFQALWKLWCDNQADSSPMKWDAILDRVREIFAGIGSAKDPEFIKGFASEVMMSLERIENNNQL